MIYKHVYMYIYVLAPRTKYLTFDIAHVRHKIRVYPMRKYDTHVFGGMDFVRRCFIWQLKIGGNAKAAKSPIGQFLYSESRIFLLDQLYYAN